jgi:hypothetical protein
MCKLEGIKWCVIKSNKPISNCLKCKLSKIRFGSTQDNVYSFYYFDDADYNNILKLLFNYKKLSFEVVKFYDKQFGLSVNTWSYNPNKLIELSNSLPLKFRFNWFNHGGERQTVTPITTKQFSNIVKINI